MLLGAAGMLLPWKASIQHTQQESVTEDGIYIVNGNNAESPLTDDGILFVFGGGARRAKITTTKGKLIANYMNRGWQGDI